MGVTMASNWSRGFFRLWVVLSLLWVVAFGYGTIAQTIEDLRLPPKPVESAKQEQDQACSAMPGDARDDQPIHCRPTEIAEERWQHVADSRDRLLSHITVYVLAMVGAAVLPPLMLLLPGLVIAWIRRGFARTPHQRAEA
jgi:hypothetical protein